MTSPELHEGAASEPDALGAGLRGLDVLLVVVVTAGVLFSLGTLMGGTRPTVGLVLGVLAVQSATAVAAAYLIVVRRRGIGWRPLGLRAAERRWYGRAVALAVVLVPVLAAINLAIQALTEAPFRNPQLEVIAPEGFSWHALFGMVVMAGAVGPFAEELVFRGLLYGWLRRRIGAAAATAVSATIFAVAHGIPILVPALLVQGLVLARLYERSGSLWPAVVLHGTFNATAVIVLYAALGAGLTLS